MKFTFPTDAKASRGMFEKRVRESNGAAAI